MVFSVASAFAAENEDPGLEMGGNGGYTHVTVANATKVNGAFFSRQFGNNTSDIDVRAMIHGYNPIVWTTQLEYITDPMVVEKLEVMKKNGDTMYVFTLNRDLMWNDGTPLTAEDFVFGYLLQASKEFEQIGGDTDVWKHIVGYEEYNSGESKRFSGIRLYNKYKYSVTVKKEYLPYFYEYTYLYMMPSPISVIAPGCAVDDEEKGAFIRNIDSKAKTPKFTAELLKKTILDKKTGYLSNPRLTCGPYSMTDYDPATGTVEFTINPYFKGNYEGVKPTITDVTLVHAFPQDMPSKIGSGEIDVINKAVSGDLINTLIGTEGLGFDNYPRLGYGFIGLSCEQGPQQFLNVRRAIAYAFDTDEFVTGYLQGYGLPVYGYYGIGQWMTQGALGSIGLKEVTPEQQERWDACSLDQLEHYDFDPEMALKLLVEDGWTFNKKGGEFDPEKDTVRYKQTDSGLMALSFKFGLVKDNIAAQEVLDRLKAVLEPMGVEFVVKTDSFNNILIDYLRENGGKRVYDMSFLAYNFNSIFDPWIEMMSAAEKTGSQNASGLVDDEIVELAHKLHSTQPGDVITFLERWVDFQERYNEILPSVPLYSNVYFDFYPEWLVNYHPAGEANWPRAILYAYVGDPTLADGTAEMLGDGEIIID